MTLTAAKDSAIYRATLGDGDGKADAMIVVGGSDSIRTVPNLNATKWDEPFINLNPKWFESKESTVSDFKSGIVSLQNNDVKWQAYITETGQSEIEIFWNDAALIPKVVEFDLLHSDGLTFYRQFSYQEEWDLVAKNEFNTIEDFISHVGPRPDYKVGSYAVYFNRMHNQYKTGKFCHIYFPYFVDSVGQRFRAESFVIDGGKLLVEKPDFSKAIGFVFLDPTIGYTTKGTLGASSLGAGLNYVIDYQNNLAPGAGTLSKVWAYRWDNGTESLATEWAGAVYRGDAQNDPLKAYSGKTGTLPADGASTSVTITTAAAEESLDFVLNDPLYPVLNSDGIFRVPYDSGAQAQGYSRDSYAYANNPPFDDPLGGITGGGWVIYSNWLEYTEAAGGPVIPVAVMAYHYEQMMRA